MKYFISGAVLFLLSFSACAASGCGYNWPLWENFAKFYIQSDGRVIDHDANGISTSEGQSYALFFSLVANDRERFDKILGWTSNNLAKGDMVNYLPAWKWGKADDGVWEALDPNPASDADLWVAYALLNAAVYWKHKPYHELGTAMLRNIARREVVDMPGLGSMLLPASYGFTIDAETWRLNPSYLPVQLLRYFTTIEKCAKCGPGPWKDLIENTGKMIGAISSKGVVPDWMLYGVKKGFHLASDDKAEISSYDAIRVYLWWAMLNPQDPMFAVLRPYVTGIHHFMPENAHLPERINVVTGEAEGVAPPGFKGALAPYRFVLYQQKPDDLPVLAKEVGYYNNVLNLFGYGWLDRRFQFNPDGSLSMESHKCSK